MTLVTIAIWTLLLILAVPIVLFALQVGCSLLPLKRHSEVINDPEPTTVVLVPAHNEQSVIAGTVRQLKEYAEPKTRIVVIADNCTDQTACLAFEAGAEVFERFDDHDRGKIYALRDGIKRLRDAPPEVVVVVDADCAVLPETVGGLARMAMRYQRPIQGRNLTDREMPNNRQDAIAIFGNKIMNYVRPLGLARIGLPCQLMGTGMAFPWFIIQAFEIDTTRLAEEKQMGFDLSIQSATPMFAADFSVTSALPPGQKGFLTQRTRWEHGHLLALATQAPRLISAGWKQMRPDLWMLALDLLVLPFAMICLLWLLATLIALSVLTNIGSLPILFQFSIGFLLTLSLLAAWRRHCYHEIKFSDFLGLPGFLISKFPVYGRLFTKGFERRWLRTERIDAS